MNDVILILLDCRKGLGFSGFFVSAKTCLKLAPNLLSLFWLITPYFPNAMNLKECPNCSGFNTELHLNNAIPLGILMAIFAVGSMLNKLIALSLICFAVVAGCAAWLLIKDLKYFCRDCEKVFLLKE